jgi:hypothetical protein
MTKAFKTNISAPAIIKAGGTSSQYLMADGSVSTGASGVKYTFASTPPSSPTIGDIWVDSSDGTEYTYVADQDTSQWVELSNAGLPGPTGATGAKGDTGATGATGATGLATAFTSKGDSIHGTGLNTYGILSVGFDNQTLIADSTQTTGMRWGDDMIILNIMGVYS